MRRLTNSCLLSISSTISPVVRRHASLTMTPQEIAECLRQDPVFAVSLSKELSSTHSLQTFLKNEAINGTHDDVSTTIPNTEIKDSSRHLAGPSTVPPLTTSQIMKLAVRCGVPFIAFGVCDNLIMITVGDVIDSAFGVTMGFSTMVAAGAGQAVSDGCGVTIQQFFENCADGLGLPNPELSSEQESISFNIRLMQLFRTMGIVVGCLIGLIPVIIFDTGNRPRLGDQLLKTLPEEQRNGLRRKGVHCTFKEGDYLLHQGEEATAMYTVLTGELKIVGRDDFGEDIEIAQHHPGDVTGAIEIIFGHKCVADVIVTSPKLKAIRLSREDIEGVNGGLGAMRGLFKDYIESHDDYVLYRTRHYADTKEEAEARKVAK